MNGETSGRTIVIGLGTGRCGTLSLARTLSAQAEASVTHEERPLLPWDAEDRGRIVASRIEGMLARPDADRLTGDVAFYYLNYVEEIIGQFSDVRFVCLRRDREQTVESYVRWLALQKNGRRVNHWSKDRLPFDTDVWDACYPKYETTNLQEGIGRYWDAYYAQVEALATKHPAVTRLYETENLLNDERAISELLSWLGIPGSEQVVSQVHANRGPRAVDARERVHDAVICGAIVTSPDRVGSPRDPESIFRHALAAHQAGRSSEAMAGYCDVLQMKPNHPGAHHLKGLIHHGRGENALARELIETALGYCDTKAVYWNNYGAVLKDLGCCDEAKAAFEKAVCFLC